MTILHAQYGYDMTINHYYKIIEDGKKTALVQEIGKTVTNDDGMGNGKSMPDTNIVIGKPFRAYKRVFSNGYRDGEILYKSKYFADGSADVWDGKPNYYNTWD